MDTKLEIEDDIAFCTEKAARSEALADRAVRHNDLDSASYWIDAAISWHELARELIKELAHVG